MLRGAVLARQVGTNAVADPFAEQHPQNTRTHWRAATANVAGAFGSVAVVISSLLPPKKREGKGVAYTLNRLASRPAIPRLAVKTEELYSSGSADVADA